MEASSAMLDVISSVITLDQVNSLKIGQKVFVKAALCIGYAEPNIVTLKDGLHLKIKEDCILQDLSSTAKFHIWENLISKLQDNLTYKFDNLVVKRGSSFNDNNVNHIHRIKSRNPGYNRESFAYKPYKNIELG